MFLIIPLEMLENETPLEKLAIVQLAIVMLVAEVALIP